MDLGSALNSIMEYDIKKHCHINTNEDGDRFVGIKADSDNAMVYFLSDMNCRKPMPRSERILST